MPVFLVITATSFATIYSAQEIAETIIISESIHSKTEVDPNKLPSNSLDFISQHHPMPEIKRVYELFDTKGKVLGYEVVLQTHTGEKTMVFNADGKYMKK